MSPWIEAARSLSATRWLDESGVALHGLTHGQARVSGDLERQIGLLVSISGQASVSGSLAIAHQVAASSVGASSVSGVLGYLFEFEGISGDSTSAVSGELLVGVAQFASAASAGATGVAGDLNVRRYSYISGGQSDDDWGSNQDRPPSGSSRDDGPTRRRFTPKSVGAVSGALT